MLLGEKSRGRTWTSTPSCGILVSKVGLDDLGEFGEVLEQTKGKPSVHFVPLAFSRKVVYNRVKWRIWRDGQAGKCLEASRAVDVDLNPGAVVGIVCCGGRTMEYKQWEVPELGVDGVVKSNMLWNQSELLCDTNHSEWRQVASGEEKKEWWWRNGPKAWPESGGYGRTMDEGSSEGLEGRKRAARGAGGDKD